MLKSSLIYLAGRYGASAITLLAIAAYTRLVSPSEYGVYSLAFTAATLLYSFALFWLRDALIRFTPTYAEREDVLMSQVAAGYLGVAAVTLAALAAASFAPLPAEAARLVRLVVPLFLSLALCEVSLAWLQARFRPARYATLSLTRTTVAGVVGSALAWSGYGAEGIVAGTVLGYVLCALPVLAETRHLVAWRKVSWERLREIGGYGLSFSLAGALIAFIAFADRYIIAWMLGAEAAGFYAAPYDLASRSLYVLMLAVNLAGAPIIFRAYERDGLAAAEAALRRQFVLLLGASLPVATGLAIMSPFATGVLLGERFHTWGIALMPWIAAATVLQGLETFFFSFAFSLTRKPLGQTVALAATAVVNVGLNLALIPRFGLAGAAMATVLTYVFGIAGSFAAGRRLIRLPLPLGEAARIALAALVMAATLWPWREATGWPAFAWGLLVALPAYGLGLLAFNPGNLRGEVASALARRRARRLDEGAAESA
ncbi:oligosaccharide flippase family protein [Alsobacter sp. SYSU M60028]|uniref:Oligosaccharide flippase family protein n=1 Tax=Alsobacter ponti TaxID=2962936 RepID=A0ABT1LE55_9HYPH|nr:oligosaccharide flippase family protein [Alsobacter ponti]MCP8939772.1 oligosaccharide flippase family protein [Alsobacter ponti]